LQLFKKFVLHTTLAHSLQHPDLLSH